ncbi:MAG: hypothetical protein LBU89_12890 [Fibromonadaceae bacterium]|jgi:hypothetical protein|nr:hypothetical protein [Fibromonadaceae bacterium]
MNETPLQTYLRAQGELGGFEIILSEPHSPLGRGAEGGVGKQPVVAQPPPAPVKLPPAASPSANDSLWQSATGLSDFYNALQKHSVYTKSMRSLSFLIPNEIKKDAVYLLLFHSPQELTTPARGILERLLKKLKIDLNTCAISFFFKCNEIALPREKTILREMLYKEIELINPEKIIFFREAPRPEKTEVPANVDGTPITFAGKPAIILYSLLEMLANAAGSKEKIIETWNVHLPRSEWFSLDTSQA